MTWVRLPWRDVWESLIGVVGGVLVLQRSARGLIVGAGGRGFRAGAGLWLGFPALPAWRLLRLHPRAGVPVVRGLVVLHRKRPRRREVGRRESPRGPERAGLNRRRRDPAQGHHPRPRSPHPTWRRPLRRLPAREAGLPQLPASTPSRLANRNRHHRRRLPTPGQRPARPDRRTLGTPRRRSHPETPSPAQQRRLRAVLDVPPQPGTAPSARNPLRRHDNRNRCLTSLQESRTHLIRVWL